MKFFVNGGKYRHRNFLDVDMVVLGVAYTLPNGDQKLKVLWVLQRDENFIIGQDRVWVDKTQLKNWSRVI